LPTSVTFADVAAAAERLAGVANRTPVFSSRTADGRTGVHALFKCENFQRAGAFKFRGAYNALSLLPDVERRRGVLTFSSGNHAGALALAGKLLQVPVTVIMPDDAPPVKMAATRGYGAEVIQYDRSTITREELGERIAAERHLPIIPPYDHPDVVAGQGTAAAELFEETGPLDVLLVPCGGGGLLSGCAIAAKELAPGCRVIGVEPERADDATRSFHTGRLHTVRDPDTIADGARTPSLGKITFPLVQEYVDDMVTVTEDAIAEAMYFLWERMKIVVEPTGALGAAALFTTSAAPPGSRVGLILSGGNAALRHWD
jgi:threo-3-hydroxy-L-aspartate ammonia-lyase